MKEWSVMSSYTEKEITCKLCGRSYKTRIIKGLSVTGPTGLDLDPHDYTICDRIIVCPECGYATSGVFKEPDKKVKAAVAGKEYQELRKSSEDRRAVKSIMAAVLAEAAGEYREASYDYLMAYWVLRNAGSSLADDILLKTIEAYELYLGENQDVDSAMTYTDLLRQAGRLEEAQDTLEWLADFIEEDSFTADIAAYEKMLIRTGDTAPHLMSEVRA